MPQDVHTKRSTEKIHTRLVDGGGESVVKRGQLIFGNTSGEHAINVVLLMEVGLVGVAGVLGEAVMDHRVLGSKKD